MASCTVQPLFTGAGSTGAAGGAGTARSAALLNLCRHHEQRFRCDPIVIYCV